jgi:hypothetical protein
MKPFRLIALVATLSAAISPPPSHFVNSTVDPTINSTAVVVNRTRALVGTNTTMHVNSKVRTGIKCGPGKGVWLLSTDFYPLVDDFCMSVEGKDISDGYMASDTYLVNLTPQDGGWFGDAGKIICKSKSDV